MRKNEIQIERNKDLEIERLKKELLDLKKSLCLSDTDIREQVQQAYSEGIKAGFEKIPQMKEAHNKDMLLEICSDYDTQIDRLNTELSKSRMEYARLYNFIKSRIELIDKVVNVHDLLDAKSLDKFEDPI